MKRLALILVVSALSFNAGWGGAHIHWLDTDRDLGVIDETAGPATVVFRYTNTGDSPLVITGARANCGCTTPRYSATALAPGDTAQLVVAYDPAGRPGRFAKKVYVDTNTDPKRSTLNIGGVVIGAPATLAGHYPVEVGPMRLARPAALLGSLDRGHVKSVFESAYNASPDTLRPVVTDVPRWLDVKTIPAVVPPGEQTSFNFFITSDKVPAWGVVTDTVTVRPYADSPVSYRLPVVITVTEDFSKLTDKDRAEAPVAYVAERKLEPVSLGGASEAVTYVTVRNDGKSPLRLRRLYTTSANAITTDLRPDETLKHGRSRTIKVTVNSDALTPRTPAVRLQLTLITNDPANPTITIPLPVHR